MKKEPTNLATIFAVAMATLLGFAPLLSIAASNGSPVCSDGSLCELDSLTSSDVELAQPSTSCCKTQHGDNSKPSSPVEEPVDDQPVAPNGPCDGCPASSGCCVVMSAPTVFLQAPVAAPLDVDPTVWLLPLSNGQAPLSPGRDVHLRPPIS